MPARTEPRLRDKEDDWFSRTVGVLVAFIGVFQLADAIVGERSFVTGLLGLAFLLVGVAMFIEKRERRLYWVMTYAGLGIVIVARYFNNR